MTAKYKKYHYNCSICGSNSFLKIYGVSIFPVCLCRNCGIVCLNPRMDEKEYEEYYRTQYHGNYQSKVEIKKPCGNIKENFRGAKIFNDLKQYLTPKSRIIEIGCGEGDNLIVFKSRGFNSLTGLEVDSDCCEKLEKFYSIKCINQSLLKFVANFNEKEKFDCAILSHTLEHFVEPNKAIRLIGNLIEPKGFLYIRVPNFYGFTNSFSQFCTPHTFYFSNITLEMLLKNSGFIIISYFSAPKDEIVLLAKKSSERLIPARNDPGEYKKVLLYLKGNRIIYTKMRIRRTIEELVIRMFGENIYLYIRNFLKKALRDSTRIIATHKDY